MTIEKIKKTNPIIRWFLRLLFIILLTLGIVLVLNWTFITRALTYPSETDITETEWYTPMAQIKGDHYPIFISSDSSHISKETIAKLTNYVEDKNTHALLIWHKGYLIHEAYFEPYNQETKTNSMSMAKTIVALLIGIAIEDQLIGSELDKVAKYIPEWQNDARNQIRIIDLLQMQSGLRNQDQGEDFQSDLIKMFLGVQVEKVALNIPLEKKPNTIFEYNNANTQILSILLERVSRQPFEQYLSEKLWQPLGANDAQWWMDTKAGMPKTFCCFFAEARDWLRIGQLILQKGNWQDQQLIPTLWIEKMISPSPLENDYGFHIWTLYKDGGERQQYRSEMYNSNEVISIDGARKQHVFILPSKELMILRTGNKPPKWDESVLVNIILSDLE